MNRKHLMTGLKTAAFGAVLSTGLLAGNANATAVDDLKTEADKLKDVYAVVVPLAVSAGVFGIGMLLIKRVAFA